MTPPRRDDLWINKIRRARGGWRWWLAIHVALLILQWATIHAAPIVMQNVNAAGWWALCVTAKGP